MPVALTFVDSDSPFKHGNPVLIRCTILAHTTCLLESIGKYPHQADHGELPTEPGRLLYL